MRSSTPWVLTWYIYTRRAQSTTDTIWNWTIMLASGGNINMQYNLYSSSANKNQLNLKATETMHALTSRQAVPSSSGHLSRRGTLPHDLDALDVLREALQALLYVQHLQVLPALHSYRSMPQRSDNCQRLPASTESEARWGIAKHSFVQSGNCIDCCCKML